MSECFIWNEDEKGRKKELVLAVEDPRFHKSSIDEQSKPTEAQSFNTNGGTQNG